MDPVTAFLVFAAGGFFGLLLWSVIFSSGTQTLEWETIIVTSKKGFIGNPEYQAKVQDKKFSMVAILSSSNKNEYIALFARNPERKVGT